MNHRHHRLVWGMLAFIVLCTGTQALAGSPVPIGHHTGRFVEVRHDDPGPGQSTWYYVFTSGTRPAISHVTFALECPEVQILDAGMWDEQDPDRRFSKAGKPEPASFPGSPKGDPTTGIKGLKFDLGFNDHATHHYYFTLNGNFSLGEITVALKAGPGFTTGILAGPSCEPAGPDLTLSSIGDRVWLDENANGIQDAGEPGVPEVTVELLATDGSLLQTTQTDSEGDYLFEALVDGDYIVRFIRPEGFVFTSPGVGDRDLDSDADPVTGETAPIELPPNTHRRDVDAGLVPSDASLALVKTGVFHPGTLDPWALCSTFGPAHAFNALIFGDYYSVGGDTEGRLAVGGNAVLTNGYSVGFSVTGNPIPPIAGGAVDMLIVGGDLDDMAWGVNGNIVHGGERTGPTRWMANGNLLRKVSPVTFRCDGNVPWDGSGMTFEDLRTRLQERSDWFATLEDRGVLVNDTETPSTVVLTGNDPVLNVFNVSASEWSVSGWDIHITAPENATVLVNVKGGVTGEGVQIANGHMIIEGTTREQVLVHYVDAQTLSVSGLEHNASVLALQADVTLTGGASINGRAVLGGDVVTLGGSEFHHFEFLGAICPEEEPMPMPPHIAYTFTVTNTGNVPLQGVTLTDPLVEVLGGPVALDPQESDSTSFSAILYLNEEQRMDGALTNVAQAVASTLDGVYTSASDSEIVTWQIPDDGTPPPDEDPDPVYEEWMKADFVLRSVELVPSPSLPGARFKALVRIANEGHRPNETPVQVHFWSGLNAYASRPEEPQEQTAELPLLHPGEAAVVLFDGLRAPLDRGTYHAIAVVNPGESLPEYSYGNNHAGSTYSLEALAVLTEETADGMLISWNSTSGYYYFVERSEGLNQPFIDLAENLDATPPLNTFLDADPPSGQAFYRVWGYKP